MPELGESITEGTITRWLKEEGDQVEADEPLFEVSTDKVDTEVPSPVAGVLQSIKVQADETVEVGAELAVIGGGDGRPDRAEPDRGERRGQGGDGRGGAGAEAEQAAEAAGAAQGRAGRRDKPTETKAEGDGKGNGKAAAGVSPLVRRLAREHDVDLSQVQGSGSGGRVRREDVEASSSAASSRRPARPPAEGGPGG